RRRHTRWPRDWSSDVCSSDLVKIKVNTCCRNSPSTLERENCTRSRSLIRVESRVPVVCFWKNAAERRRIALYIASRRSVIIPNQIGRASCRERGHELADGEQN